MAPGTKTKSTNKSKGRNKGLSSKSNEKQQRTELQDDSALEYRLGQEPSIQAFWDTLTEHQRQDMLTLDIGQLQQAALERTKAIDANSVCSLEHATLLSQGRSLVDVLEQGVQRLDGKLAFHDWKVWRWPNEDGRWAEARVFRQFVEAVHIQDDLMRFMPKGDATKAEADALQTRMMELYKQVQFSDEDLMLRELSGDDKLSPVELITILLAGLEQEHPYLYHFMLFPVINAVSKALPKSKRATNVPTLSYCDLEKVPHHVVSNICDWLHIGVLMLGRREGFGKDWLLPVDATLVTSQPWDYDKFCISPHDKGRMQLNPLWYEYLQAHSHGNMAKPCAEESKEPKGSTGLDYILQWVLGVKCDPETLRGWIQSTIGTWVPTVQYAHQQLLVALRDFKAWHLRAEESKQLLRDMLVCRADMAEHRTKYDLSSRHESGESTQPCELPDHVVAALLKREALLNQVRAHTLKIQQIFDTERMRSLQNKQLQGEPKFECWKAMLRADYTLPQDKTSGCKSSGKPQPRAPLHIVTAHSGILGKFERLGATLRAYETEEKTLAMKIAYHDEEIKRCAALVKNVKSMASALEEIAGAAAPPVGASLQEGYICPCCNSSTCATLAVSRQVADSMQKQQAKEFDETAVMLKQAFQEDVRYQLHADAEDHHLYQVAQKQLRLIEKRQQAGQAVLPLLEAYMVDLACDDPCTVLGPQLILPMLRMRLMASVHVFGHTQALHDQLQKSVLQEAAALRASQELIAEEEQKQALAAAKKARKERAKAKKQQSHECPLRKPDVTVESPDAVAAMGTFLEGTELSTSSASAGKENACDVASMNTLLDVRPSSGESAIAFMRSSDQKERPGSGIEGSVLSALPTRVAGSALTTDSSISSFGSSTLEERMLHLMLCPITQAVMDDPVIAADGHTYEKAAMQKWLQQHHTSPVTGETLTHVRLVPNIVIRSVIQQQLL